MTAILQFPTDPARHVRAAFASCTRHFKPAPKPVDCEQEIRNRLAGYPDQVVNNAVRRARNLSAAHSVANVVETVCRSVEGFHPGPEVA